MAFLQLSTSNSSSSSSAVSLSSGLTPAGIAVVEGAAATAVNGAGGGWLGMTACAPLMTPTRAAVAGS